MISPLLVKPSGSCFQLKNTYNTDILSVSSGNMRYDYHCMFYFKRWGLWFVAMFAIKNNGRDQNNSVIFYISRPRVQQRRKAVHKQQFFKANDIYKKKTPLYSYLFTNVYKYFNKTSIVKTKLNLLNQLLCTRHSIEGSNNCMIG